jgi:anhydro-N-acetylmuramic acid kinase
MVYNVIGLMSGSSMDGLDIAFCNIEETGGKWEYSIEFAACIPFSEEWKNKLATITKQEVPTFMQTHTAFGAWMGQQVNAFIEKYNLHHKVHIIGSHGHTAFHFPENKTTVQIGCGAALAAATGINVVSDLRAMDMALGGHGAPIVPIAEKLFFADAGLFLNIGGICNISARNNNNIIAFDICPANRVLNELALELNMHFDENGNEARNGNILPDVLTQLNALDYYNQSFPKSLANEIGTEIILPILQNVNASVQDKLCTMTEHIAMQVAKQCALLNFANTAMQMMVTGGGAYNSFLIERLQEYLNSYNIKVIIPDNKVIEYKEALAMALIAVLRWREEENVLASVTGASRNSIGGALWMGNQ